MRKIAWIGIDIDAGTEDLYETIRRSLTGASPFNKVIQNAKNLINSGVNVDFKVLLNPYNDNEESIHDLFKLVKEVKARKIYFRPVIVNNQAHTITESTLQILDKYIGDLTVSGQLSKQNIVDAKQEQKKIIQEMNTIKQELDSIVNTVEQIPSTNKNVFV